MSNTVGENIRLIRHMKGMSQDNLAKQLKVTVPAISKIETGATDINLSRLEQIASAFGISIVQLLSFNKSAENNKISELSLVNEKLLNREMEMADLQKKVIGLFEELRLGGNSA